MQHRHDSTTRRVSVDDVLNEIGFGRFHWKLLFICGFGWAADNMWLTSISFILLRVQPEWKLSDTIKGLTGSSMFLGTFCGAYVWGYLSDRIGRKPSFTWTLAIASAGGFASACAPNFWSLMVGHQCLDFLPSSLVLVLAGGCGRVITLPPVPICTCVCVNALLLATTRRYSCFCWDLGWVVTSLWMEPSFQKCPL